MCKDTQSGNIERHFGLTESIDDETPVNPGSSTSSPDFGKNTTLCGHGRPPWYGEDGKPIYDAFVIGIAGGSGSGKTYIAQHIIRSLGYNSTVTILSQDSFYKKLTPEETKLAFSNHYDFDHPDAIDMSLFASCLADLKAGRQTNIPTYSFTKHQRLEETQYLYGANIIIAEGIVALHDPAIRALYDLKVYVQCDSDLMLARRIKRDIEQRGRDIDGVLEQYLRFVKPAFDTFVKPTSKYADIIVPGMDNSIAVELITTLIRQKLEERSNQFRLNAALGRTTFGSSLDSSVGLEALRLAVLPQTPQLMETLALLRNGETSRQDFTVSTNRLSVMLVEKATKYLLIPADLGNGSANIVDSEASLVGKHVCGISISRSSEPLRLALARTIPNLLSGSLLVRSNGKMDEPLLMHVCLPHYLRERDTAQTSWVFLLDTQINKAASTVMAIRTFLDHGVREDHIVLVTFAITRGRGIAVLRNAFPDVKIICGTVNDDVQEASLDAVECKLVL